LLEIVKSNNSIEDADDTYFPSIEELLSFKKDGRPEQGLSGYLAPQTVDETAMKSGRFSNPDKSTSGGNIGGSQGSHT
jgi:hypothetical protein